MAYGSDHHQPFAIGQQRCSSDLNRLYCGGFYGSRREGESYAVRRWGRHWDVVERDAVRLVHVPQGGQPARTLAATAERIPCGATRATEAHTPSAGRSSDTDPPGGSCS